MCAGDASMHVFVHACACAHVEKGQERERSRRACVRVCAGDACMHVFVHACVCAHVEKGQEREREKQESLCERVCW